ncbi:BTAD domain-containing putative transcriptional regulator [Nonomuraea sp. CA-218870]|uniref:BTAD domain-containing putative transcriptional regulator n=1 Tax=Nonomuraea sp. CA-218870 TaxID=3239998 RepID=UPI003D917BD8
MVFVSVLGHIEVTGKRLTAQKPAILLATLVAAEGEPVKNDRLVEALWRGQTPRSAVDNLRVYVAQLRRTLGGEGRLVSRHGGYALLLAPDELDAGVFGERERAARRLIAADDLEAAAHAARQALDLWRGPVFDGLDLPDTAGDYARRLEERRTALTEDWVELQLALGRHRETIGELRALVAAHPLRERPHGQLMLALHRSGRRAEALDAYQEARRVLVAELGLEPGGELQAIQADILRGTHAPSRVGSVFRARFKQVRQWTRLAASLLLLVQAAQPARRPDAPPPPPPAVAQVGGVVGDGMLTIATLLPMTGSLYFIGASTSTAAELAVQDVNAAGGVLGHPVRLIKADSGDATDDLAVTAVRQLVEREADVIVGPASNFVSMAVLDTATEAGIVMISPSTTAASLSTVYDRGLYFRTSASDTMQGRLIGRLLAEDGNRTAGLIALEDSYGDVLVSAVKAELARRGVDVVKTVRYRDDKADFSALAPIDADALVLIGFTETLDIMRRLERGNQRWYLVDANLSDYSEDLPRDALTGTRGTLAGVETAPALKERMRALDPAMRDFSYAAEVYDAVVLAALAARAARGDLGKSVAGRLAAVSGGGRRCTTFAQCAALLDAGVEIDYDGLSGRVEFDSNGDVGEGTFGVYTYKPDNTYVRTETRVVPSQAQP